MKVLRVVTVGLIAAIGLALAPSALAQSTEDSAAKYLFGRINNYRSDSHDLPTLSTWSIVVGEAAKHSGYQAQQGRISHDGFDARSKRIMSKGSGLTRICENVGYARGISSASEAMRVIFSGWDRSAPHHACMFDQNQHSKWAGIGIKQVGSDTWYATFIAVQDTSPSKP